MRKWLVLACVFTVSGVAAQPAPQPSANDPVIPQWAEVETVQARRAPGPALWHVTKGNSEVWILGTIGATPKALDWNKQSLADLLDGANLLLTPPGASVGLMEGTWLLITYGGKLSLPRGTALEATLPVEMRARFVATRTALGQDEDRYKTDTPLRAAIRLQQDFRQHADFNGDVMGAIFKMARDRKVPVKPAAQFEAAPLIRQALDLPQEQQRACLLDVVQDVDELSAHGAVAASAWAVGDLNKLKANFADSRLMNCLATATHAFSDMNDGAIAATTAAIANALNKPGKSVAVIGMGNLLRKGGVLEQLEAQHLTIEGPAQ